jgi:hypothetical protein
MFRRSQLLPKGFADGSAQAPTSLEEILAAAEFPEDAAKDGYRFVGSELKPDSLVLLAEPEPGVTGSDTLRLRMAGNRTTRWLEAYVRLLQKVRGTELPAVQADMR